MIDVLQEQYFFIGIILMIVSFCYSSVGHGGASGYLVIFVLFSVPVMMIRPTALLMNIVVSGISFFLFARGHHFKWKLFLPFALTSIPAAFLGGLITINPRLYKIILAIFILFAILRMVGVFGKEPEKIKSINLPLANGIGIVIGLCSGMIGIGGGIILSPAILLCKWGTVKQTAAVSALFILVNSIAGLIGTLVATGRIDSSGMDIIPFVLVGAILGAYYGSQRFPNYKLQYMLRFVLVLAFFKLIIFP